MVDLHLTIDASTPEERAAVSEVLDGADAVVSETARLARGGLSARRSRRHLLLPALHALQHHIGWISPGGLNHVCSILQVPPAEAYGVATFYDLFRTDDPGHRDEVVHVCADFACAMAGADELAAARADAGEQVRRSPCLGQCERAPARFVQGRGTPDHAPGEGDRPVVVAAPPARITRRIGVVDPGSLASYRANGGYEPLRRALELGSAAVVDEIEASGLVGRGGAAFPTAVKWRAVADGDGDRHVVANVDESEPGTFKDRVLLEQDPFALVEALTIAGLVTGAEHGWIYVRGEYPLVARRLLEALGEARGAGLLGEDVAGSGRRFDVELRRGAGAYICGEETALFNSIEGFRGEPRNKPPFPTTSGLFGRPTVVNNPETLFNVLDIVAGGAAAYRSRGTADSPGTRAFCLSGHVARPGVYEVDLGTTLADLLAMAGGPVGRLRAVLLGGAAGRFVGPGDLDVPLSFEGVRERGLTLGSGAIGVFDDSVDLTAVVVRIAEFFRHESCGQCVPCRVGTARQHDVLVELRATGELSPARRQLLGDLAAAMADASICGLGHTAASAVRSAIELGLTGAAR